MQYQKKRKITISEMQSLREQGYTYQKIADISGLSKQRVSQLIGKTNYGHSKPLTEEQCVYPNLRKWMNENRVCRMELTRRMYNNMHGRAYQHVSIFLKGVTYIHKPFLDKLLKITGMTYEELFAEN